MAKYKPGDKVRVRSDLEVGKFYKMEHDPKDKNVATELMVPLAGKVVTIKSVSPFSEQYRIHEGPHYWTDEMFDSKPETIVIYRKGNKVIALNKTTKETAEAKCSPEDTFDFATGARLAFDRLLKTDEPRFKVGDLVVGTEEASREYCITHEGYIGRVKAVGVTRYASKADITIASLDNKHQYFVESKYFRPIMDEDVTADILRAVVEAK